MSGVFNSTWEGVVLFFLKGTCPDRITKISVRTEVLTVIKSQVAVYWFVTL